MHVRRVDALPVARAGRSRSLHSIWCQPLMGLTAGQRVGGYEVLSSLGAGGMGEVYRARDTKLGREVALKILPEAFASDPDRLMRFEREARTLAALNHPHIAQIHGFEQSPATGSGQAAVSALVMELVEGDDLAERLARGALPIDEALAIATQIADALEAAHEAGIIHRDLKPANIKVRPDGSVKVLDFGLAKFDAPARAGALGDSRNIDGQGPGFSTTEASAKVVSPTTVTSPAMTVQGMILGTAAYMAQEQARGRAVDRRADTWAFGCVLYEILTGARALDGDDTTEILGAIIKTEPNWSRLPATLPPQIVALLRRCLHKDPRQRLQHIGDARVEIDEAIHAPAERVTPARRPRPLTAWIVSAVMTAIAATAVAMLAWRWDPVAGDDQIRLVEAVLPDGVETTSLTPRSLAISSDGQQLAMVGIQQGVRRIYLRGAQDAEARVVEGTTGAMASAFSTDGRSLAVIINTGQLRVVSLVDGLVRHVAAGVEILGGVAWLDDDRLMFGASRALWTASPGETPSPLTTLDAAGGEVTHTHPVLLPGRRVLLRVSMAPERSRPMHIDAVSLDTGVRTRVIEDATLEDYAVSGHLVFMKDGVLVAAPFDPDRLVLTGAMARIPAQVVNSTGVAAMGIAQNGVLAYGAAERSRGRLMWVSRTGEERAIDLPSRDYMRARVSPDGRRLAFAALDDGLWVYDLERQTAERIAGGPGIITEFPVWSLDGQRVIAMFSGGVFQYAASGGATGTRVSASQTGDLPASITPDGRFIGVHRPTGVESKLYLLPLEGADAKPLLESKGFEAGPVISPDGEWFA